MKTAIRIALIMLLCLAACAPAAAPLSIEDFIEDLSSSNNSIWQASRTETEPVILEALRVFDPALQGAYIVVIKDSGLIVVEARSQYLERQNVLVLLAFQDANTVLGVFDLKDSAKSDPQSLAVKLEVAITAAMNAKFRRGRL